MILSTSHKFIGIHIPKNAGSSIEQALTPYIDQAPEKNWCRFSKNEWCGKHAGLQHYQRHKDFFDSRKDHLVFAFVRNSWDRAFGHYWFLKRYRPNRVKIAGSNFTEFVAAGGAGNWPIQQCKWVTASHRKADFVGRYETLEEDFARLCKRVGISPVPAIPHANQNANKPEGHYRQYYNDATRDKVGQIFADDIKEWGFEF